MVSLRLLGAGCLIFTSISFSASSALAQACDRLAAEFIDVEGDVEIMRDGSGTWVPANTGDNLCLGDSVRTLIASGADLRLADGNKMNLKQGATFVTEQDSNDGYFVIRLFRGIIHLISRDSRALKFSTPYTNAGLDGTEFLLAVTDGRTEIQVIDGTVTMGRDNGEVLRVESGEAGIAADGEPLARGRIDNLQEAMAWTLYFDPVWSGPLVLHEVQPTAAESNSPDFFAARAAGLLSRGQYELAVADIDRALSIDPLYAEALALQAIVENALNRSAEALALAEAAIASDPESVTAWLALSYARQAMQDQPGAGAAVAAAIALNPNGSLIVARQAELRLVAGDVGEAAMLADRAIQLDSEHYRGYTMRGFSELQNLEADAAIESFRAAIARESSAPLPRLGLGLALIKNGDIEAGREELELAVALDPNDPRFRSYAASAYFEELRETVASRELDLASVFAPQEPTSAVFSAPQKQLVNRTIEAFREMERAASASEPVLVSRSTLNLDADLALRSAGRGRIYRDVGLADRGQLDGTLAVLRNPLQYEGHRLLADTSSARPDHEITRASDYAQAQLLQPVNVTAIPPELGESNLLIAESLSPGIAAFDEYSPQLTRDHWAARASFVLAGNGTEGERVSVSGLNGKLSYSVGHYGVRSDGFRPNSDLDTRINNGFLQYQFNASTSALFELRTTQTDTGDRKVFFNPDNFVTSLRQQESVESLRLGFRRSLNERATLIGTVHRHDADTTGGFGDVSELNIYSDGYAHELVGIAELDRWNLTAGVLDAGLDQHNYSRFPLSVPFPPFELEVEAIEPYESGQESLFAYGDYRLSDAITITLGGSVESLSYRQEVREQFNPKLGLVWEMPSGMIFRAAAFRTLQGALISRQNATPRLEPTRVAGFAQYLFGSVGDDAERVGIGIDHRIGADIYFGADVSARTVETSLQVGTPDGPRGIPVEINEDFGRAYLHWFGSDTVSFSAELERDEIDNHGVDVFNAISELDTTRLAVGMKHFHPRGFSAGIKLKHIRQSGIFAGNQGTDDSSYDDSDRFWVADAFVAYRLPQRRGEVSLGVQNLFDETFKYQDRDPGVPRIIAERLASLRLTLAW